MANAKSEIRDAIQIYEGNSKVSSNVRALKEKMLNVLFQYRLDILKAIEEAGEYDQKIAKLEEQIEVQDGIIAEQDEELFALKNPDKANKKAKDKVEQPPLKEGEQNDGIL